MILCSHTDMQGGEMAVPRVKVALLTCTAVGKTSLVVMASLELRFNYFHSMANC